MASKSDALKVVCNVRVYTDRPNGHIDCDLKRIFEGLLKKKGAWYFGGRTKEIADLNQIMARWGYSWIVYKAL